MVSEALLTSFADREGEEYDRQTHFDRYRLFAAEDALDAFSSHARTHVLEVIRQCLRFEGADVEQARQAAERMQAAWQ